MSDASEFVVGLPFVKRVGVRAEDGALYLDEVPELQNHVGTLHAGALFTLGESASGVAVAAIAGELGGVPVAKSATIDYKRPANGRVRAVGKLREPAAAIAARAAAEGKAVFDVDVVLQDAAGTVVAQMTVAWHVRPPR